MNQTITYYLTISCLLLCSSISAQNIEFDCNSNINEAINFLQTENYTKQDSLKVIELLKPCVEKENPYASLLLARLYLNNNVETDDRLGFNLTLKAARLKNPIACSDLGDLYKYGIGCLQDFAKAEKWFRKGAKLNDDKSIYSLGYLFYKGLGNSKQNYKKAIKLFEQTDYPMAKHWLGTAYYFGYGVKKNTEKALSLLTENSIENSTVMVNSLKAKINKKEEGNLIKILETTLNDDNSIAFDAKYLTGKWKGNLVQLDWSKKNVEQVLPISVDLVFNEQNQNTEYELKLNSKIQTGLGTQNGKILLFDNLNINIKRPYYSGSDEQDLQYNLEQADFEFKQYNNKSYLTAYIESYVEAMAEPGNTFAFILEKQQNETENGKEISDDTAIALASQDSFIKLYPNPFKSDLFISYSLDHDSFVDVEVSDLQLSYKHVLENGKQQKAGNYTYYFNGSLVKKGINVITVLVNGNKHTKLIVKK